MSTAANDGNDAVLAGERLRYTDEAGCLLSRADDDGRGILHGRARASGLAASDSNCFWHAVDCRGHGDTEPLYRTRLGPLYAAHGLSAAAQRLVAATGSIVFWRDSLRLRARWTFISPLVFLRPALGMLTCLSYLLAYTPAEKAHRLGNVCRSVSRSHPADDWVGGRDGLAGSRRLAAVCNSVFVAISTFPRDCLDVP